jgi:hypothetical protein
VNFSGARDSFGIIFQKSRSNCEIRDYWLILEKPRGFFVKLPGIFDFGIIFARKKPWTRSTGCGPRPASNHSGAAKSATRRRYGSSVVAARGGGQRGDMAVSRVSSPEMEQW